MLSQFFARRNPFFPRICTVVAIIIFFLPFEARDEGFRYLAAAWLALLPWVLHALNIRFGVDRHDGDGRKGGSDSGGYIVGDSSGGDSGCGGDGGGGGGDGGG